MARFAMTSFAFMFVDVPDPVWKMSSTKCESSSPVMASPAARSIASPSSGSRSPSSRFTREAASLIAPSASMKRRPKRRSEMGKFWRARSVCAP